MNRTTSRIRTPDQKLRVFLSSTLKEMAAERVSARSAIERLHLAPVMFELGARPHPPRDLYRAYLDQSDIFIGIYGRSYGWVAPTESVSGLEDEFDLSAGLPRLIYIQETAEERDPRLTALLGRVRDDDRTSFKYFAAPEDLVGLVERDLATLLADRFAATSPGAPAEEVEHLALGVLPAPVTELVGRSTEISALRALLSTDGVRLVSVTGPGGMGKSRLAIAAAGGVTGDAANSVFFVDLAPVTDTDTVPRAIAQALGVRDTGDVPITDKIVLALRERPVLLVLDNFEQIMPAAPVLTVLLTALPLLTIMVTTRTLLRISGEHNFELGPLSLPRPAAPIGLAAAGDSAAVRLFVQRARAVKPDFELTASNVASVIGICIALDGVPLALELAAARLRLLTPRLILERLDRQLLLLTGGVSDLPHRQQTLRNTIEWSTQLLHEDERHLLAELGVFSGGFSLEAAEHLTRPAATESDILTMLGTLVDSSLVRQEERNDRPFFTMLTTVHEFARDELRRSGGWDQARAAHAQYFVGLARRAEQELDGPLQAVRVRELSDDHDNLRAAARSLLAVSDWRGVTGLAWSLYIYWWIDGHLGEIRALMDEVLASAEVVPDLARAQALYFTSAIRFWQDPGIGVVDALTESSELFAAESEHASQALALVSLALAYLAQGDSERADSVLESSVGLFRAAEDRWGEAMALVSLGLVALVRQKIPRALNRFEESQALTRIQGDELGGAIAEHHCAWARFLLGDHIAAAREFTDSLATSVRLGHDEGIAYGLEGLMAVTAAAGDIDRAGVLLGAAQSLRSRTGLFNAPSFSFHQRTVDDVLAGPDSACFAAAEKRGRALTMEEAIAVAIPPRISPAAARDGGPR